MDNPNPEKDSCKPINIENAHVVEKKPGMGLEELIEKIRAKTQHVLAEKAKKPNHPVN